MVVTLTFPDGVKYSAGSFEALEDDIRLNGWNPPDPAEYRDEMAWRGRIWKHGSPPVNTAGNSEEFINSLAAAGLCTIHVEH